MKSFASLPFFLWALTAAAAPPSKFEDITLNGVPSLKTALDGKAPAGKIIVRHLTGDDTPYTPSANTDAARGTILRTAVTANTTDGDTIFVGGGGVFDLGPNRLALGGASGHTVHLVLLNGAVISSTADLFVAGAVVYPGNNSEISGGTIRCVSSIGSGYQACIGVVFDNGEDARTGVKVTGVTLQGSDSDAFYLQHTTVCTATLTNCTLTAKWDTCTIASDGSTPTAHLVECYNCRSIITGPSGTGSNQVRCFAAYDGATIRLHGCTANGTNGGTVGTIAVEAGRGGIVEANDLVASVSDTTTSNPQYDFNNLGGTLTASGGKGSGAGGAWLRNGKVNHTSADTALQSLNVKAYGAVGDGTTDDTAAIQAAITAAAAQATATSLKCPEVFFPAGVYYTASGIVCTSINSLTIRGPGAVILIKSDVDAWTFSACRDWKMDGLSFGTTANTTHAALRVTAGSIGGSLKDFKTEYQGGTKFQDGVFSDGAYIWHYQHAVTLSNSVSGIGLRIIDSSGVGTYAPAASTISDCNIGAGTAGIYIEGATNALIDGGTVEDNTVTKNVWLKSCKNVTIRATHMEVPSVSSSNVYMDSCSSCVVDTIGRNAYIDLVACARVQLRNLNPVARMRVDNASTDTVIFGGQPDSAPHGLTEELGTNTMILGSPQADGGGILVRRSLGQEEFNITYNGSFGAILKFHGDANAILFRNGTGALRTTGTFAADAGLSTQNTVSGATGAFTTITGAGSGITAIDAANIASGNLARGRIDTALNANANAAVFTTLSASGAFLATVNTASTSTTTGGIIATGGVGIGGALWTGGDITAALAPSATPLGHFLKLGENARAGTDTNVAGGTATFKTGVGTGTGTAAQMIFQVPTVVASGTGGQGSTNALTLDSSAAAFAVNVTTTGVLQMGASSYLRPAGRGRLAASADGLWQITKDNGTTGLSIDARTSGQGSALTVAGSAYAPWDSLYDRWGAGSPEGVVTAPISAIYHRTDGSTGTSVYRKEAGTGNTGWVASSAGSGGTGDFVGPASATDNAIVRFDGTTGKLGQNSAVTLDDSGNLGGVADITASTATVTGALNLGIPSAAGGLIVFADGGSINAVNVHAPLTTMLASRDVYWQDANGTVAYLADLASYQPLSSLLTSWTGVTRASGFDTFVATPSGANLAALLTSALTVAKGGTGLDTSGSTGFPKIAAGTWSVESAATHRTSIGATTVGGNLFTLTNPSAISFIKIAADNSVSTRTPSQVVSDLSLATVATSGSASDLGSGTLPDGRFPATLPAASGANLTAINGSSISSGTVANARLTTAAKTEAFGIVIDGGGSAITTGIKGDVSIPYDCTISSVTLLADQSGSCVVDVWKDTYANYPPTVADTITASAKPTITAATKATDSTLTGWTTSVTAGDTIRFNVDSTSTITRLTLVIKVTK